MGEFLLGVLIGVIIPAGFAFLILALIKAHDEYDEDEGSGG